MIRRWRIDGDRALIEVLDEGPDLPASDSQFVPLSTTKPGGSGIASPGWANRRGA